MSVKLKIVVNCRYETDLELTKDEIKIIGCKFLSDIMTYAREWGEEDFLFKLSQVAHNAPATEIGKEAGLTINVVPFLK